MTCAAIFLQHLIPPKVLTLRPNAALVSNLYGHQHSGGQPSAYWVDETQQHFHCDYSPTDPYSCGYTIAFGADPTLGIDLTGYEALQLKIRYQGEAPRIRIFMRNYNSTLIAARTPVFPVNLCRCLFVPRIYTSPCW